MTTYLGLDQLHDHLRGAVLTIGNFDGVHLGHQRILRTAHALARVSSAAVAAMTFEPHPINILRPAQAPPRLTPWEEKLRQLEHAGAQAVIRLDADAALLGLDAEEFVREVIVKRVHPSYVVEGPNFRFGRGRQGSAETLRDMSARGGFQVHVVEPYRLTLPSRGPLTVSSTTIRELLAAGAVEDAAACLGRPYTLVGPVVHGAAAGRHLGYPTINLNIGSQMMPGEGVYAGCADIAGVHRAAAISIGRRPTLGGHDVVVEAFVLDEQGDWYAQTARLELIARIRDQRKFESREALTAQITRDIQQVRERIAQ